MVVVTPPARLLLSRRASARSGDGFLAAKNARATQQLKLTARRYPVELAVLLLLPGIGTLVLVIEKRVRLGSAATAGTAVVISSCGRGMITTKSSRLLLLEKAQASVVRKNPGQERKRCEGLLWLYKTQNLKAAQLDTGAPVGFFAERRKYPVSISGRWGVGLIS